MRLFATRHARKRIRQRLGIPTRAIPAQLARVQEKGTRCLRRSTDAIVFAGYAYMIDQSGAVMTVFEDRGPTT